MTGLHEAGGVAGRHLPVLMQSPGVAPSPLLPCTATAILSVPRPLRVRRGSASAARSDQCTAVLGQGSAPDEHEQRERRPIRTPPAGVRGRVGR